MNKAELEKMGLTAEALEKAGLPEDLPEQIIKSHGKGIESLKAKVTAGEEALKKAEGQLTEANETIEGFKSLKPDELKKSAEDWKKKYEEVRAEAKKASEDADAKVKSLAFNHALDAELKRAGAKNEKSVRALLKLEDLKLNDEGQIVGLDEQLKVVKEANDFLFEDAGDPPPKVVAPTKPTKVTDKPGTFADAISEGLKKT